MGRSPLTRYTSGRIRQRPRLPGNRAQRRECMGKSVRERWSSMGQRSLMNEPTTITAEERPSGVKIIRIEGDLDSMGTHMVESKFDALLAGSNQPVIVDIDKVSFISSAGMAMLLVKGKRLRQQKGQLVIANANDRVLEVLSLAGFNELFDLYSSIEEAVSALEPADL